MIFCKVSQINFISGYTVPQEYSSISEQNDLCRLISFQEAVANTINVYHSNLQNGFGGKLMGLHNFAHTEL
jgi:hypothetical protein